MATKVMKAAWLWAQNKTSIFLRRKSLFGVLPSRFASNQFVCSSVRASRFSKGSGLGWLFVLFVSGFTISISQAQILFSGSYSEDFNSYAGSSATLPAGWAATPNDFEGTNTGTSSGGGFYAYGSAGEFSLGVLRSGGSTFTYSVEFENDTGSIITALDLAWDYEQWRFQNTSGLDVSGTGGLAGNATLNAADLTGTSSGTNGTPNTTSIGVLNLTGLNIASGSTFGIDWSTVDASGSDNGLAIDNFSLELPSTASTNWTGTGSGGTWQDGQTGNFASPYSNDLANTVTFEGTGENVTTVGTPQAGSLTFSSDSYDIQGAVQLGVGDVEVTDVSHTATISADISGSGASGLTKSGAGTLVLTGSNSYTGGTTISAGALQLGDGTTNGSGTGNVTNDGTFGFNNGSSQTFGFDISGSGNVTKEGVGTLTLSGINSYSGGTTVSAGNLTGDSDSLQGAITNNATVTFNQPSAGTYSGVMSGTGALTKTGAGTLTLSGASTYSGGTTVSGGILAGSTDSIQGNITNNAAVVFNQATDGTYAGDMTGSGSLTKQGTGTVTLTGTNSYSGGTAITEGTLQLGDGTTDGSIAGDVANDGTIAFNNGSSQTFGGNISGSGSLTKNGAGELTLSGTSDYSGGTTISEGSIIADSSSALGTGTVTLFETTLLATAGVDVSNDITVGDPSGPVTVLTETFETDGLNTRYTAPNGRGTDADQDYFDRISNATSDRSYTNVQGTFYWGGQDTDDSAAGVTGTPTLLFSGLDITNVQSLEFSGFFAEQRPEQSGEDDIDSTDFFLLEYQIDSGGFENLLAFEGSGGTNGTFLEDTNFDGTGDGTQLETAFAEFMKSISGTGSTLDLRVTLSVNSGDEDIAFDSLSVTGTGTGSGNNAVLGSDITSGTATFSGNVTLDGDVDLTAASGGTSEFTGVISGTGSVNKVGDGTVVLTADNTFTGTTTVKTGTLALVSSSANSTIGSSSTITVESGATLDVTGITAVDGFEVSSGQTLGGTGTVNGETTLVSGSTITGATNGTIGTLTFSSDLTAESGSTWLVDLVHNSTNNSDFIDVSSGTLDITGANLQIAATGTFVGSPSISYRLAQFNSLSGTFSGLTEGSIIGGQYAISYGVTEANYITLTAVPEPTTFLLLAPLLFAGFWLLRRRKRELQHVTSA